MRPSLPLLGAGSTGRRFAFSCTLQASGLCSSIPLSRSFRLPPPNALTCQEKSESIHVMLSLNPRMTVLFQWN